MQRIDAHQHFWKFDPVRDAWIDDTMRVIQRDFYPTDLKPLLEQHGFDGCISVQADQSQAENDFLLSLANQYDFIEGIVGWVDLQDDNIEERLAQLSQFPKLKGFRHVLQSEPQRDFMLRPAFQRGIGALQLFDFAYDVLIYPDQLNFTRLLIESFPAQRFVIDHLAKPYIKNKNIEGWKRDITSLAKYDHVYCKVSGMVTEAAWKDWEKADFRPYLDVILQGFGTSRLMFGSDWPVCTVAGTYTEVVDIVQDYFSGFSIEEQNALYGGTASKFYNL